MWLNKNVQCVSCIDIYTKLAKMTSPKNVHKAHTKVVMKAEHTTR